MGLYGNSCIANDSNIYCVGGSYSNDGNTTRVAYVAGLSNSGIGNWSQTTWYPQYIDTANCVPYLGYMFCVGGSAIYSGELGSVQNFSYYAPILPKGLGNWTQTTFYPADLPFGGCVISNGYLYCMGQNFYAQQPEVAYYTPLFKT